MIQRRHATAAVTATVLRQSTWRNVDAEPYVDRSAAVDHSATLSVSTTPDDDRGAGVPLPTNQRCPWVGLTHGLGWVGSTTEKILKIWKDYVNAFKARLDKIWFHQAVKFDFTADLTGTGNR